MSEVKKEVGIEELKEAIEAMKDLAVVGAKVAGDKKVSLGDIKYVQDLVKEYDDIKAGVTGLDKVKDEIKDIDGTEVAELLVILNNAVKDVKTAYESVQNG